MASSRLNKKFFFDPIRGRLVEKTPEEEVRQRLLNYLCKACQVPMSLIAVEKSIKEMPHLDKKITSEDRRIDVICYARNLHPAHALYPLILAECKADSITQQAVEQALGYNAQIGAAFVVLACPKEIRLYSPRAGESRLNFLPHLPPYEELVKQAKSLYA